jgi:hypothetical protein
LDWVKASFSADEESTRTFMVDLSADEQEIEGVVRLFAGEVVASRVGLNVSETFTDGLDVTGVLDFEARDVPFWPCVVVFSVGTNGHAIWMVDWA